jgi:methionine-gamma-lyase
MVSHMPKLAPETQIVHGLSSEDPNTFDLVAPIHLTSAFRFKNADHGARLFNGQEAGYVYSRIANPTVTQLQQKMAALEGGEDAVATASGMAAIAAATLSLARPGDNFIACTTLYGGTFALFSKRFKRLAIEARWLTPSKSDTDAHIEKPVDDRTRFLYLETPANPTLDIIDIEAWAAVAERHHIPLIVDNTFATPYLQNPLALGAQMVVHSTTKYIGGHADVLGGVVIGSHTLMDQIREEYLHLYGPTMSPFSAWLFLRGIKTLAVRMEKHCANAMQIAAWLENHPKVQRAYYPGLKNHSGHRLARKQMKRFGGMLAFEVLGGIDAGKAVMDNVQLCRLAVSLGDCDTLIQHPASMTHSTYTRQERENAGITDGLIRLSVGIEHAEDIMADLDQALATI